MGRRLQCLSFVLSGLRSRRTGDPRFLLSISAGSAHQGDFSDGPSVIADDRYSSLVDCKPCFMTAIMMESE